jgi:hypothetical protein
MHSLEKAFKVSQNNNLTEKDLEQFEKSITTARLVIDPFYQNEST